VHAILLAFLFLAADPTIRMETDAGGRAVFRVSGASDPSRFAVYVDSAERGLPGMAGEFRNDGADLVFSPRYPLQPGLRYRAVWKAEPEVTAVFEIPAAKPTPPVKVEAIYPSASVLPSNQLKFYIHFSGPMSETDSYRYIHLLRADGREVDAPFLLLGEELWDRDGKRFTLLFNPGRVKRDLVPNKEMGAPLESGQSYSLAIDAAWPDASGRPLQEGFRKNFRVGPEDRRSPDPKTWKLTAPAAGGRAPL